MTAVRCPIWCVVDHAAEAARLRDQAARHGQDWTHDPDAFASEHAGAERSIEVGSGHLRRTVVARPWGEIHENQARIDVYVVDAGRRERDLGDEPLTLDEAAAVAQLLTGITDTIRAAAAS